MAAFDVTLEGEAELLASIARAERVLSDAPLVIVTAAVKAGAKAARERHPYTNRTGDLERETQGEIVAAGPGFADGEIKADMPYASFVDKGTSRSRAYPFMIIAEEQAASTLAFERELALRRVIAAFER